MNIYAIIGSPRKGGNTEILVDKLFEGASKSSHESKKVYLYKNNIMPCIDCRRCKKGDYACKLDDDMQKIYPEMDAADLLVFATPNYWFGPSAKMKLLVDRMRPYVANKKLKGKKAVLIVPAADGPEVCKPLVEMFHLSFSYLEMELVGQVLGTAYEKREILNDQVALEQALAIGLSL